jgi:hypothetical protein
MPGAFARVMREERQNGRYPDYLLTLMLYRNGMKDFFDLGQEGHAINYLTFVAGWNTVPSCHPMALRFMNMVSDANFLNDESPSVRQMGNTQEAQDDAQAGADAVLLNDKAIWVTYGHIEGHSFVLIAGAEAKVESLEGWAGGAGAGGEVIPNPFHTSVLERADQLAGRPPNSLPTKAEARAALLDLVHDDLVRRYHAADKLSRASYWGFDHASKVAEDGTVTLNILPSLQIHVANLRTLVLFRAEVKKRLSEVGFYRQKAVENHSPNKVVCCHCQEEARFFKGNWRECTHCGRHFCRTCKGLLAGHAHAWVKGPGDWLHSLQHGQRTCDGPGCGHQTRLISE